MRYDNDDVQFGVKELALFVLAILGAVILGWAQ
jgi:hypothetical protein